jgi:hypothetical protein
VRRNAIIGSSLCGKSFIVYASLPCHLPARSVRIALARAALAASGTLTESCIAASINTMPANQVFWICDMPWLSSNRRVYLSTIPLRDKNGFSRGHGPRTSPRVTRQEIEGIHDPNTRPPLIDIHLSCHPQSSSPPSPSSLLSFA